MGLKIDGIATNGALDSSGEILNVDGIDITDLIEGKGVLNWEHEKSSEDTIGAIIYAKKIESEKDCETDRQKYFWKASGIPYVYVIAELFDDEEHPGAVAAAALIRYYAKRKEKLLAGFSIEGQTLTRKGNMLDRSVARKVALTLRPCNKACIAGLIEDAKASQALGKTQIDAPSTIQSFEVDSVVFEDPAEEVREAVAALRKTLTASGGNVAPSQLVGGAALGVEDRSMRNKLKAALRDWNRTRPLREVVKAALPELSDKYVDHFVDIAHDLALKKGRQAPVRIDPVNSINPHADDAQKKLVDGLYMDPARKSKIGPQKRVDVFGLRNDAGQNVVVKAPGQDPRSQLSARHATAYYQLARDFFNMKDHVPVTNYFSHGGTDNLHQAMEHVDGSTALEARGFDKVLDAHRQDGSLHRLALMDLITGHGDRHYGNVMVGKDQKLKHIDNDDAFHHDLMAKPSYFSDIKGKDSITRGIGNDMLSGENVQWLASLDPRKMASMLAKMRISPQGIAKSVHALKTIQSGGAGQTLNSMWEKVHGDFA